MKLNQLPTAPPPKASGPSTLSPIKGMPARLPNRILPAGDRLVFVFERDVCAIDVYAGALLSNATLNGRTSAGCFPFQCQTENPLVTVAAGSVFVLDKSDEGESYIKALRLADGRLRQVPPEKPGQSSENWEVELELKGFDTVSALAGFDDEIIVVTQKTEGTIASAYKTSDASPAWGPIQLEGTPGTIARGEDAIYYVSDYQLYANNTDSGELRFPQGGESYNLSGTDAPLVGESVVACVGGGTIYGFDIKQGTKIWSFAGSGKSLGWNIALSQDQTWLVAANGQNEVHALDLATGQPLKRWPRPTLLPGSTATDSPEVTIADDLQIWVLHPESQQLWVLDAMDGSVVRGPLSFDTATSSPPPVIENGNIFVPTTAGLGYAPFSPELGGYFDGTNQVAVGPGTSASSQPFAFAAGDYTLEAWVRSCPGGHILSAAPGKGTAECGFLFEVTAEGELRHAVFSATGDNPTPQHMDLVKSLPSHAADGDWHHVAVVRRNGEFLTYVDGISSPVATLQIRDFKPVRQNGVALQGCTSLSDMETVGQSRFVLDQLTPPPPPPPTSIGGPTQLALGMRVGAALAQDEPSLPFIGLLREVRVWNVAVSTAKLKSRMNQVLRPLPHLVANWHLNDSDIGPGDQLHADVIDPDSITCTYDQGSRKGDFTIPTGIQLSYSDFPYLLEHEDLAWPAAGWPYDGLWAARGESPLETPPASSSDGAVCFGTGSALYGVKKSDGSRLWGHQLSGSCSAPAAFGSSFYVLAEDLGLLAYKGLVEIDARTGEATEVEAFESWTLPTPSSGTVVPAPVTDGRFVAAAGSGGEIGILDLRSGSGADVVTVDTRDTELGNLVLASGVLCWTAKSAAGDPVIRWLPVSAQSPPQAGAEPSSIGVDCSAYCVDGGMLFYTSGGNLCATPVGGTSSDSVPLPPSCQVTGMAADVNSDQLVVSTAGGQLLGYSAAALGQRWAVEVPHGGEIFAPVISGSRAFVTSSSGVVAAVGLQQGALLGALCEENSVITPPLVEASGTVYYGCSQPPKGNTDGALHSAVFGDTVALRLGLDTQGGNDTAVGEYVSVTAADAEIALQDGKRFCVEAWVNVAAQGGGEVVSICPSEDGAGLGLSVSVAAGGLITSQLYYSDSGTWQTVTAKAAVPEVCDGNWHCLSISYKGGSDVRIYVDAMPQTITNAPLSLAAVKQPATTPGLLAYFGADATRAGSTPATFFSGMIAEVRLWANYRKAREISKYLNVQLRGDEPDLQACWTFDTCAISDCSPNRYGGVLEGSPAATAAKPEAWGRFWLTDLAFDRPSYPYLTSKGKPTNNAETDFQLTLTARKADGSPLANAEMVMWYVTYPDREGPPAVGVSSLQAQKNQPSSLEGIPWSEPNRLDSDNFMTTTDAAGQVVIQIRTSSKDAASAFGPSFKVCCTTFMQDNEYYDVNVLVDKQTLARPAPPTLVAQSKLIQDYQWTTGNTIDASCSISTYRTVITALNGNKSPRAHEIIEIWAEKSTSIEVDGKQYTVNPQNSQEFQTDASGQLTVVMAAKSVQATHLSVWAGFMNRQDRVLIDPSEDAHTQLGQADATTMTASKLVNWGSTTPSAALLNTTNGLAAHASSIAPAVHHVMTAVPSSASTSTSKSSASPAAEARLMESRTATAAPGSTAEAYPWMQQPIAMPRGDTVSTLRHPRTMKRRLPVTSDLLQDLLEKHGFSGFSFGNKSYFQGLPQSKGSMAAVATSPSTVAGEQGLPDLWFGSSTWNHTKHDAEHIYHKATKTVVTAAEKITATVTTAVGDVEVAVATVADAVKLVEHFFEQLAIDLEELIDFLLHAFDWTAILAAANTVEETLDASGVIVANCVETMNDVVFQSLETYGSEMLVPLEKALAGGSKDNGGSTPQNTSADDTLKSANSVAAKMVLAKILQYAGDALGEAQAGISQVPQLPTGTPSMKSLVEMLPQLAQASHSELGKLLTTVLEDEMKVFKDVCVTAQGMINISAQNLPLFIDAMKTPIEIPFLGELYEFITGGKSLQLRNLFCLALGCELQVTCYSIYDKDFAEALGSDFTSGLESAIPKPSSPGQHMGLDAGAAVTDPIRWCLRQVDTGLRSGFEWTGTKNYPLPWCAGDSAIVELFYTVARFSQAGSIAVTDGLFAANPLGPKNPIRDLFKVFRGASGLVAELLFFLCSTPYFVQKLNNAIDADWDKLPWPFRQAGENSLPAYFMIKAVIGFVVGIIGCFITGGIGLYKLRSGSDADDSDEGSSYEMPSLPSESGDEPSAESVTSLSPGRLDAIEFWFLLVMAIIRGVLQFIDVIFALPLAEDVGEEAGKTGTLVNLKRALLSFELRDLAKYLASAPGFMFTETAALKVEAVFPGNEQEIYTGVTVERAGANAAALFLHVVGELFTAPPLPPAVLAQPPHDQAGGPDDA